MDGVYVERLMRNARHIEVQVLGDGAQVMALGERECSLQRRFQKLVEIAPSPSLAEPLRRAADAGRAGDGARGRLPQPGHLRVPGGRELARDLPFVFIEANPRLQVEHTVTEEVTGVDLVQLQIAVAAGATLASLGLDPDQPPRRAVSRSSGASTPKRWMRSGDARPSSGTLERFDLPAGPGVRVDTHGIAGARPSPHYDTLLAKLIVHSGGPLFADAVRRSRRALAECRIEGVATNLALLRALAARPEFDNAAGAHALPGGAAGARCWRSRRRMSVSRLRVREPRRAQPER